MSKKAIVGGPSIMPAPHQDVRPVSYTVPAPAPVAPPTPTLPLVEQVVGLVELDLDLVEPIALVYADAASVSRSAVELLFLV